MDINQKLAQEFKLKESQVTKTLELLDEGNTVPFIARYRKEATGGLTDVTLRELEERLTYLRNLEKRKEEVVRLIAEQEKLTPELEKEIMDAEVLQRVEDLYKPYKAKKATRASKAKERGLQPLADMMLLQGSDDPAEKAAEFIDPEKEVNNIEEALQGAMDIIAEMIADDPDNTAAIREKTQAEAVIVTEGVDPEEKTVYEMYYDHAEALSRIPNHRVLAINRGEKEKKLKVKVQIDPEDMHKVLEKSVITSESSPSFPYLKDTIADAYKRLMAPSIEREMRSMLTERAEAEAVKVFAKNTENLLMAPPVAGARIISIDPGYRTGCKVAVINQTGKLLAYTTIYPTQPKNDVAGTEKVLTKLIEKFKINTIVIGNGTASRETEEVVANFLKKNDYDIQYTIVNEAGASVYSASKLASEEYPDLDVTTRGAMSLGRRLQDPLAELVKIDPKHIGVGQYQHDINQGMLNTALTNVVENCVNRVGVNLNTASPSLLSYIAGINMGIAKNIVAYREENGTFKNRKELMKVPKLGPKAFTQCAGFMRIADGEDPLDSTSVHPESYEATRQILANLGIDEEMIRSGGVEDIEEKIVAAYPVKGAGKRTGAAGTQGDGTGAAGSGRSAGRSLDSLDLSKTGRSSGNGRKGRSGMEALKALNQAVKEAERQEKRKNRKAEAASDSKKQEKKPSPPGLDKSIEKMAEEVGVGALTLKDIVSEIKKPARDPREDAPAVIFRNDVRSFEDLKVDMELTGTVRNVVDFGAFVDIGVKQDGLVHISEMSNKYISHPMDVVSVGDTVKVKILAVDHDKQKISLTMKI